MEKTNPIDPQSALPYNNLAILYVNMGKQEEAITLFKKAIQIDPKYEEAYYNLSGTYKAIGKEKESKEAYENYRRVKLSNKSP